MLFAANKPVFPVDTHIMRVSKRLGIIKGEPDYERIRRAWEKALPREKYATAHILLILHGRNVCKSGKPLCNECPITRFCKFYRKFKEGVTDEGGKKGDPY